MVNRSLGMEIGGYFEFERFDGTLFHDEAIALNSGRSALAYLIESRGIRRLLMPDFLCDAVGSVCERYGITVRRYPVGPDLRPPNDLDLAADEWLYLVNYFGQLSETELSDYSRRYERVVFDYAQSYFSSLPAGGDTIYTCRKYFGVADGGFVATSSKLNRVLDEAQSHEQFAHILGRFERTGSAFYDRYAQSEIVLGNQPLLAMSRLTKNLLRAIDYPRLIATREANFAVLHDRLGHHNRLAVRPAPGPYAYPFFLPGGREIRPLLHKAGAYVATLWPNVLDIKSGEKSFAHTLAADLLPLPVDQRYSTEHMHKLADFLEEHVNDQDR
jgi:hypothetical protein